MRKSLYRILYYTKRKTKTVKHTYGVRSLSESRLINQANTQNRLKLAMERNPQAPRSKLYVTPANTTKQNKQIIDTPETLEV